MDRLTEEMQIGVFDALKDKAESIPGAFNSYDCFYAHAVAVTRLKQYEDTGLEPEEIHELLHQSYGPLHKKLGEWIKAEQDGRLVVLPCKVGCPVYRIYDDCTLPGDCGTKRMCQGCEFRNLFIEEQAFCINMLCQDGTLGASYYKTREEAETALISIKGDE